MLWHHWLTCLVSMTCQFSIFVPLPTTGRQCRKHYVCRLSLCALSVCPWGYLHGVCWRILRQIVPSGALWIKFELISFQGQKVKVRSQHDQTCWNWADADVLCRVFIVWLTVCGCIVCSLLLVCLHVLNWLCMVFKNSPFLFVSSSRLCE